MTKATVLPVQSFRDNLAENVERVVHLGARYVLARRGKPRAALVSIDDLRRLEELDAKSKPAKRRPK